MKGTLHKDLCTFMISRSLLLRMRNVADKDVEKIKNTHCTFNSV